MTEKPTAEIPFSTAKEWFANYRGQRVNMTYDEIAELLSIRKDTAYTYACQFNVCVRSRYVGSNKDTDWFSYPINWDLPNKIIDKIWFGGRARACYLRRTYIKRPIKFEVRGGSRRGDPELLAAIERERLKAKANP